MVGETGCRKYRQSINDFLQDYVKTELSDLDLNIILHGSYATGLITAFSDIDLLAFVSHSDNKEYNRLLASKLQQLTLQLHRLDPLMHHNVDVVSNKILENYDESTLPVDAISQSVSLLGNPTFSISPNIQISQANAAVKLVRTCHSILTFQDTLVNRTPYRVKCLISALFLVPILLLQSHKRIFLYKRESLALAEELYGDTLNFKSIHLATKMRYEWTLSRSSLLVRKALIPFESRFYSPLWLQRISGSLYPMRKSVYQELLKESKIFVEDVLIYAKKSNLI